VEEVEGLVVCVHLPLVPGRVGQHILPLLQTLGPSMWEGQEVQCQLQVMGPSSTATAA
jgi:hypothetical protein